MKITAKILTAAMLAAAALVVGCANLDDVGVIRAASGTDLTSTRTAAEINQYVAEGLRTTAKSYEAGSFNTIDDTTKSPSHLDDIFEEKYAWTDDPMGIGDIRKGSTTTTVFNRPQ